VGTHEITPAVLIIGGGIIGGSIAWELARRGLHPLVLDRQEAGREASWAAAGMLQTAPDNADGIPLVPLARASLALYPKFVEDVETDSGRAVGLRRTGAMEIFFSSDAARELSTFIALNHGLGLPAEALSLDDVLEMEPALSPRAQAAAFLPEECALDSRALTDAVLAAAVARGAVVLAGVEAESLIITGANRTVGASKDARARVEGVVAAGHRFTADHVILAAGAFSSRLEAARRYAPTRPVRGQMVALLSSAPPIQRVLRSARGYIVPRDDLRPQRLVAGSTLENAGYEKRVTSEGVARVLEAAQELVPDLADAEILETWCGLRPDTPDHLPILGPTDLDGLTIATGHFRNGILLAPITAKLIADWIIERRTSFDWEIFSPLRFSAADANR
jgi:glycine oxidase